MRDTVKTTHESWAIIQANRVSGRSDDLFATSIDHQHTVQITISRASEYRSLNYNRYSDDQELIRVEMSPMQWAELITSMNCGPGAPCTLRRFEGKQIKGERHQTETVRIQDEFSQEAKDVGAKMEGVMSEIRNTLESAKVSKKVRDQINGMLFQFSRQYHDHMPFIQKMFAEACEGTVTEAKAAVDAFVTHAVVSAGLESLGAEVQKRLSGATEDRCSCYNEKQPDSGGYWLWREGGDIAEVRLLLTDDGHEVADCDEDEPEDTPQYYWEQTPTDQKTMPGLWRKEEAHDELE